MGATIGVLMMILWMVSMARSEMLGGVMHLFLVIALILFSADVMRARGWSFGKRQPCVINKDRKNEK